jgi:hypothetical protein
MNQVIADSAGNKAAPGALNCPPVLASGISIAMATAGDDYTGTVAEGAYIATANKGFVLASLTGVTSTAANIEFCIPNGATVIINVPYGKTTLYCEADTNSSVLYLRKLDVSS